MKVVTLLENKKSNDDLINKHGISLYFELSGMKLLVDTGPDDTFIRNASRLGVDLSDVDFLIISHGHSDHGGGIQAFLKVNEKAKVIISKHAFETHYAKLLGFLKLNVGIDKTLKHHDRVILVEGVHTINEHLVVFDSVCGSKAMPTSNRKLMVSREGGVQPDDFKHEIYLVIKQLDFNVLVSGCSHRGIINILNGCKSILDIEPEYVFAGMHLYNPISRKTESMDFISKLGEELITFNVQRYHTFHCTGTQAYGQLKEMLGDRIVELDTGTVTELN